MPSSGPQAYMQIGHSYMEKGNTVWPTAARCTVFPEEVKAETWADVGTSSFITWFTMRRRWKQANQCPSNNTRQSVTCARNGKVVSPEKEWRLKHMLQYRRALKASCWGAQSRLERTKTTPLFLDTWNGHCHLEGVIAHGWGRRPQEHTVA